MCETDKQDQTVLDEFYKSYWDWIQSGAPNGMPYYRDRGLCSSIVLFAAKTMGLSRNLHKFIDMITEQFEAEELYCRYPFGFQDFMIRQKKETMHECPKRLDWVKRHLKEDKK